MGNNSSKKILVTGATGYIGGRLVPKLLDAGYVVRVLVRDARRLEGRLWRENVEVYEGDVLRPETLSGCFEGVTKAYYLIHSMMNSSDFYESDLIAARNFGELAKLSNIENIIYLGGLGNPEAELSKHLRSRQHTGDTLRSSGLPITEFRAAVIVGAGSISFEIVRYLGERLPVMICPRWVYTRIQPISIEDVLVYLVAALNNKASEGQVIEIGGEDVLTYGDMIRGYAKVRGLRRYLIPVPVLTPRLSSHWVHWMTPIPAEIARPLIDGMTNEVVVRSDIARRIFPEIIPMDYAGSVKLALNQLDASQIETTWSDSLASSRGEFPSVQLSNQSGMIIEKRQKKVEASPDAVFSQVNQLGGENGWLFFNLAWHVRGVIDRMVGGVGFRRGRRHPTELRVGDAMDFWRVEAVQNNRMLRLKAEMKVPGSAWLQFETLPFEGDSTQLKQTAFFAPKGLAGFLYWYLLYPLHALIFSGLIKSIARKATEMNL